MRLTFLPKHISLLIERHAPVEEINDALGKHYSDDTRPPQRDVLCWAIHYNHTPLAQACLPLPPGESWERYCPYVAAIEARNMTGLELLLGHQVPVKLEGFWLRPGEERGLMSNVNSLHTLLQRDDVQFLRKLIDYLPPEKPGETPLAHLALRYNASQCFQLIADTSHPSLQQKDENLCDVLLVAATAKVALLQTVIGLGFRDAGQMDNRQRSSLHHCLSSDTKRRDPSKAMFIEEDTLEKIELLISVGAQASTFDMADQLPIYKLLDQALQQVQSRDDIVAPYPLEQHSQLVLRCCRVLLERMRGEMGPAFRLPNRAMELLQGYFQTALTKPVSQTSSQAYLASLSSCLTLLDQIISMFLHFGVHLKMQIGQRVILPHCTILDRCLEGCIAQVLPCLSGGEEDAGGVVEQKAKLLHQYILKLMAYGAFMDVNNLSFQGFKKLLQQNPRHMEDTAEACVSLLSERVYNRFMWKLRNSELMPSGDRQDALPPQAREQHPQHPQPDTHNLLMQFEFRSLRELCRLVLYAQVTDRNMVKAVHELPLPHPLKEYLTFGIKLNTVEHAN